MFIKNSLKLIQKPKNQKNILKYALLNNHIIFSKNIQIQLFNIIFKNYIKNIIFNIKINISSTNINFKKILLFFKLFSLAKYNTLIDITAVDFPGKATRFLLKYIKLNIELSTQKIFTNHIFINYSINEITWTKTISDYYKVAQFYEREVLDMFGIYFFNNPSLFRILTDYGFNSYPLRKDFPLSGFEELRYNELKKKLINTQDFWLIYLKNHKNKQLTFKQ